MKENLESYLRQNWRDAEKVSVENLHEVKGGWSKRTLMFDAQVVRQGKVELMPLVLRVNAPEMSAILPNHRATEHTVLERLRASTRIPVPRSYLVESTGKTFGQEAMVLERMAGNTQVPTIKDEAEIEKIATHLIELIAQLHTTPMDKLNKDGVLNSPNHPGIDVSSWERYMSTMIEYFIAHHHEGAFDVLPVIYDSLLHMRGNRPKPMPLCVVHGELNPNNLIVNKGKIVGIIDWERCHVGDPREDLAWFAWFEAALTGTHLLQSVKKEGGFLGYYNKLTGFNVSPEDLAYFTLFSHADVCHWPLVAVKRRQEGKHQEVLHEFLIAEPLGAQAAFTQILQYMR